MNKILEPLRKWNTWWLIPVLAVVIYYQYDIVRWIDPVGQPMEKDVWQFSFYAVMDVMWWVEIVFLALYANFVGIFKWYITDFYITPKDAPWLFVALFGIILLAIVLTHGNYIS